MPPAYSTPENLKTHFLHQKHLGGAISLHFFFQQIANKPNNTNTVCVQTLFSQKYITNMYKMLPASLFIHA